MPIYTYKCNHCHKIFDEFVLSNREGEEISCSDCKSPVTRVFSPVGIIFKGSGFYSTDYGAKNKTGTSASGNGGTQSESKKETDGKKTESKESSPKKDQRPKDKVGT